MKFVSGSVQPKPMKYINIALSIDFKKPKSQSQCITKLKEINQKVTQPVWEFDQRFKTLTGHLSF